MKHDLVMFLLGFLAAALFCTGLVCALIGVLFMAQGFWIVCGIAMYCGWKEAARR